MNITGEQAQARDMPAPDTETIAGQNDRFRVSLGRDADIPGRIVMTQGVNALMSDHGPEILSKLITFADFSDDNDPYGNRDFGVLTIGPLGDSQRVFWKIDLYDVDYLYGSEAPSDPTRTRRVLTLLLPSEY